MSATKVVIFSQIISNCLPSVWGQELDNMSDSLGIRTCNVDSGPFL